MSALQEESTDTEEAIDNSLVLHFSEMLRACVLPDLLLIII